MPAARPAHVRGLASAFARVFRSLLNRVCGGVFLQEMSVIWRTGQGPGPRGRVVCFEPEGAKYRLHNYHCRGYTS